MLSCWYVQLDADDSREHVEVCPEAGIISTEIADRIAKYHGFALIADYGHTGDKMDTFRVISIICVNCYVNLVLFCQSIVRVAQVKSF